MAEERLDGPDVGAGLQQVGGEAVAERVDGDVLLQAGVATGAAQTRWMEASVSGRPWTSPGKSHPVGRAAFQYSRRTARSRGESMT